MLPLRFEDLFEAGCIQTHSDRFDNVDDAINEGAREYFFHIMQATFNNPCSGCPVTKENCKAYLTYHSEPGKLKCEASARHAKATTPPGGETVAQIAARLGISKNEVRRRKVSGTL